MKVISWCAVLLITALTGCVEGEPPVLHGDMTPGSGQPNILLIVADDMGFSDIEPYGSEISTPNLQQLADDGLTFTNFHTSLTCSPSRAMLLTGRDNHLVGLGSMAETTAANQEGVAGYEGHLRTDTPTIAELLKAAGYNTYMAGKWHLGLEPEHSAFARGFERTLAILYGAGSHFADRVGPDVHRPRLIYRADGKLHTELPEDFYSTRSYTDRMIEFIERDRSSDKPFFAYLAYTAPHWPLQAPEDYIRRQKGRYDVGFEEVQRQRIARLRNKGILPSSQLARPYSAELAAWDTLSPERRRTRARDMEIYAAMIEHMDTSIGRLFGYLRDIGEFDNTVVIFMSDNGAEAWSMERAPPAVADQAAKFDNSLDNRGKRGSFVFYGPEWAAVSNTPLRLYKGSTAEGGIRVPLIIAGPGIQHSGRLVAERGSVVDLLPTLLELVAVKAPEVKLTGQSLQPVLEGQQLNAQQQNRVMGFEMWGHSALYRGDWKIARLGPPWGQDQWELFNISNDPAELENLAKVQPELLEHMIEAWKDYASSNNIIMPDLPLRIRAPGPEPTQ